jgi:hypothetical protein
MLPFGNGLKIITVILCAKHFYSVFQCHYVLFLDILPFQHLVSSDMSWKSSLMHTVFRIWYTVLWDFHIKHPNKIGVSVLYSEIGLKWKQFVILNFALLLIIVISCLLFYQIIIFCIMKHNALPSFLCLPPSWAKYQPVLFSEVHFMLASKFLTVYHVVWQLLRMQQQKLRYC